VYIIVVGCGKVGLQLLKFLSAERHYLVAIDRNEEALDELGPDFPGLTLLGNAIDTDLLERAGIERADAVAVLTGDDNTNLIVAQIARMKYDVSKVLARLFHLDTREPFSELGIHALSPAVSGATDIRNFIEDVDFHRDTLLYNLHVELVRMRVKSHMGSKRISAIQEEDRVRVIAVIRDHRALLPDHDISLQTGDIVVAAVRADVIPKLRRDFRIR